MIVKMVLKGTTEEQKKKFHLGVSSLACDKFVRLVVLSEIELLAF
jgi:hypothetical protein